MQRCQHCPVSPEGERNRPRAEAHTSVHDTERISRYWSCASTSHRKYLNSESTTFASYPRFTSQPHPGPRMFIPASTRKTSFGKPRRLIWCHINTAVLEHHFGIPFTCLTEYTLHIAQRLRSLASCPRDGLDQHRRFYSLWDLTCVPQLHSEEVHQARC